MYKELYEAWNREVENIELQRLSSGFYSQIANYFRRLKEEGRMLDKRSVKARLLRNEIQNVKRMVRELVNARHRKLVEKAVKGEKIPSDFLTDEEKRVYNGVLPFAEEFQNFADKIFQGYAPKVDVEQELEKGVVRFLQDVPAIIGGDMETYGPFKAEDVASLPVENCKILVNQGLAESVEV